MILFQHITPDQLEGARFLAERRVALLGDKIGFGKSAQFVHAANLALAERVTVICPPVLRPNEVDQFEKWSLWGFEPTIIRSGSDPVPMGPGLVVVSYHQIAPRFTGKGHTRRMVPGSDRIMNLLRKRGSDVLILDEAHAVKDPTISRAHAIFGARGVASTAKRIWFVTGTPCPNNAGEWYTFAKAAGLWEGTHNQFVNEFCITVETMHGTKILGTRNEDKLKALLQPVVLARNKVDPDRPPLTVDEIGIEGRRPDYSGIDPLTLEAIEEAIALGDWRTLDSPAVSTVRRQIGAAKAEAAAELLLVDIEGGARQALAFCEYTTTIDTIAAKLGDHAAIIDGRTSAARRQSLLTGFQFAGTPRVLICQRSALKEGVTLTAANRVYLVEPAWTPTDNDQMIGRAWRRTQKSPVHASYVYLRNSFDEQVAITLARKTRDLAKIDMTKNDVS